MKKFFKKHRRISIALMILTASIIVFGVLFYLKVGNRSGWNENFTVEVDGETYTSEEYNEMKRKEYEKEEQAEKEKKAAKEEARIEKEKEDEKLALKRKMAKMITFIDDDGYESFYKWLLPVVIEKKVNISTAVETGHVGEKYFMTWEQIAECHDAGAEILNHSRDHVYSNEVNQARTSEDILEEMADSIRILREHGYEDTCDIYVYPGASAVATWDEAQQIMRVGINSSGNKVNHYPLPNRYTIDRYRMGSDHTPDFSEMKMYIDEVANNGGWELWMMHSNMESMNDHYIDGLKEAIDYCGTVGVKIVSVQEALDFYGIESLDNDL